MKITQAIWVLSVLCCIVNAKKQYQPNHVSQTLHYDDDELPSRKSNSPYPQITDSAPNSYQHPVEVPNSHQYDIPSAPVYRHNKNQQDPKLFGYYTYPRGPYDTYSKVESPEIETKYTSQPVPREDYNTDVDDQEYLKPEKKYESINPEEPEELQYSHDSKEHAKNLRSSPPSKYSDNYHEEYPSEKYDHSDDGAHVDYPTQKHGSDDEYRHDDKQGQHSASSYPAPKRDPKLPLYFTMYEKRVIQDPLYKYGKGPWRYLTYGHGITYGSKEPGKVFERGYGYIRALGRDHCKLPENLCPQRDNKPFEYDGRKEPYFGYRPH